MKSDKEIVDLVRSIMYSNSSKSEGLIGDVYDLAHLIAERDGVRISPHQNRLILMLERLEKIDHLFFRDLEKIND